VETFKKSISLHCPFIDFVKYLEDNRAGEVETFKKNIF
jgi:hypothetical protein